MTDELSRLFEAERAVRAPAGGLERGLSRLLADVGKQVAPLPVATGSLKLGLSALSKWLIVGFVAGIGGAGAVSHLAAPSSPAALGPSARPVAVAAAPARAVEETVTTVPTVSALPAIAIQGAVATSSAPRATASAKAADATTFDAEMRLIEAAQSELERGRPHLAVGWLSEHAQRFPNGVFSVDREALRVLATCQQQRDASLAQRFAAQHPSSAMVERLLRACSPTARGSSNADFSKLDK